MNHKTKQQKTNKMNKTFNINLGGYPFSIDEDAFEYINNYLNTIRKHFSTSEGCDEILYDIEVRMAELFQEHLKGRYIITMKEIDEVISIMGKPEDFGAEPIADSYTFTGRQSSADHSGLGLGKKLFRNPDDKKIGGVCSGIAAYFGIEDPLWVRLLFLLLFFTGPGVIIYLVLMVLLPEAKTTADKLMMRGEPTTVENIARKVEEELTQLGDKITDWSMDMGSKKKDNTGTQHFAAPEYVKNSNQSSIGALLEGSIFAVFGLIKYVLIFVGVIVLVSVGISLLSVLFGLTVSFPYLSAFGPESVLLTNLGLSSLYLTIGLPLVLILLSLGKWLFKYNVNNNLRIGLYVIWGISLFVTSFVAIQTTKGYSVVKEVKTSKSLSMGEGAITINVPKEQTDRNFGIHIGDLLTVKDNRWAWRKVDLTIEKSNDNQVHIETIKSSRGKDTQEAMTKINDMDNDLDISGNRISISKYITFNKSEKFRNQSIQYRLYIPEGQTVRFEGNVMGILHSGTALSSDEFWNAEDETTWTLRGGKLLPLDEDRSIY